jgi:hypothetical protein
MKAAALALCIGLAGCAMTGPGTVEDASPGVQHTGAPAPQAAQAAVHAGDTKAQVIAALGEANGYRFDSGWEVWVYRWLGADRSARGATEFVVLFGPDGRVRKSRIRPGVRAG